MALRSSRLSKGMQHIGLFMGDPVQSVPLAFRVPDLLVRGVTFGAMRVGLVDKGAHLGVDLVPLGRVALGLIVEPVAFASEPVRGAVERFPLRSERVKQRSSIQGEAPRFENVVGPYKKVASRGKDLPHLGHDQSAHLLLELACVQRLRQVVVGSACQCPLDIPLVLARCEHDDHELTPPRVGAHVREDLEPIETWHFDIQQNKGRDKPASQHVERALAVLRHVDLDAPILFERPQGPTREETMVHVVVDQEDMECQDRHLAGT